MFLDWVYLIVGLLLIIAGGNYLTDGSVAIARRFKISEIVIGLTIVAIGSSTPDLVVALMSTIEHKSALAVGDIVGANIFDLALVAGIIAVIRPFKVSHDMSYNEVMMLVLSSRVLFFIGDDLLFDHTADLISRTDGLILLCFMFIYMRYTLAMSKTQAVHPTLPIPATKDPIVHPLVRRRRFSFNPPADMKMWLAAVCVVGGLGALVLGGNWIVKGATGIALGMGISQSLVGLTMVAIGSSVPDLATSLIAALKNRPQIAFGNIVGACAFNVFFIIGLCSGISSLNTGNINFVDFGTLALASILLWIFSITHGRISRAEGIILIAVYVAYFTYLVV